MTLTIFLGSLLLAMAIGIPISFALLVSGVALMWHMDMFEAQILAQNLLGGADNYPLLAVPFFLLAGEIMNEGGLSKRIVEFAMALVGHIRGGLGYVTIVASIVLVIFGVTANVSISKLFMAGIVPGLLMGASLWITWAIVARKEGVTPP